MIHGFSGDRLSSGVEFHYLSICIIITSFNELYSEYIVVRNQIFSP
jgi:hypothetical protein